MPTDCVGQDSGSQRLAKQYKEIIYWHENRIDELLLAVFVLGVLLLLSLGVNIWLVMTG